MGTNDCFVRSILTASDVMWGLAFVESCSYLTMVANDVTKSGGACDDLGDGFLFSFGGMGVIGVFYLFVVCSGVMGSKAWIGANYAENQQEGEKDKEWDPESNPDQTASTGEPASDGMPMAAPLEGAADKQAAPGIVADPSQVEEKATT